MASPEVEIYKSVKRFSDFVKDSVVNSVVTKMQGLESSITPGEMNDVVRIIEATFEQCNMNGFREVESVVQESLNRTSKTKNARR
tara:strand:+ start:58 stop:312 length:255 start_codon:yes stop_codon:yes gene_type:complete